MYIVYILHESEEIVVQSKSDFYKEPDFIQNLAVLEYESENSKDAYFHAINLSDTELQYRVNNKLTNN